MRKHEKNMKIVSVEKIKEEKSSILDFFIPFFSLLFSVPVLLLYFGGWGSRSFVCALQNAPTALVLCSAASISIVVSLVYYFYVGRFCFKNIPQIVSGGIKMMWMAVVVLLFAWTLGSLLRNDVKTGQVLASLLGESLPVIWLPCIFFLISTVTSLALGSAWGTTAILFPIAIPMILSMAPETTPEQIPILFPVFGAILSGAVCGCNVSIMADTTIMSSTSTSCNHIDHINTQWRYIVPIFISTSIGFIFTGLLIDQPIWISILLPLCISIICSFVMIRTLHGISKHSL